MGTKARKTRRKETESDGAEATGGSRLRKVGNGAQAPNLGARYAAFAIAGLLLGSVVMAGLAYNGVLPFGTAAPPAPTGPTAPPRLPTESAVVVPATPVPLPTGWDTTFSQRLEVKLVGQFDSTGAKAWDASKHALVYVTTNSGGYGGFLSPTVKLPGVALIDGYSHEVILEKQYKLDGVNETKHFEAHGVGVSGDGKWIYLVTADMTKKVNERGRVIIINAETMKIHQILQTSGNPHHAKAVDYYDGKVVKSLVLIDTFNWQTSTGRPGSGTYVLDPNDKNRVVGGFRSEDVQANPYLAFPHPDGRHLFVGLPPGPIQDPDIRHHLEGMWAVIDMKTWLPVKYYKGGFDPIWTAFTTDGKFAYLGDGGSDEIFKIDNVAQKPVGASRSSVHGMYGLVLNWNDTKLYTIEKGEASHNRGTLVGHVDPVALKPVDSYETHCLRGDHGILHPDPALNEFWISYNSNFRDVVFSMSRNEMTDTINHSGSSHNGAFVKYTVDGSGQWTGELLSDQSGLHGSARAIKEDAMGVKEIVYGTEKTPVSVFRAQ